MQALRFVQNLVTKRFAAAHSLEVQIVCRIISRGVYQTLETKDIRHRRGTSTEILFRRMLSLNYPSEHTGLL